MDTASIAETFDDTVDEALIWISDNATSLFDWIRAFFEGFYDGILIAMGFAPWFVVAILLGLLAWRIAGLPMGIMTALGLAICWLIGLWPEAMSTFALVVSSTFLALIVAIPVGVLAGLFPRLNHVVEPVLDLIQTMPPYIYLLPAIALLGFGPATALAATLVVAMPPAVRLTSLGVRNTPRQFIELGWSNGMTNVQMFFKIRLPFALPSIMAGVNQSLMMAFGMVVIAGIVGSGGLGGTIYEAIRTLDIGKSIDAAVAIVILTMIIDRMTQNLVRSGKDKP
ncbi:ABC transporter permease subunit [Paracoccus sp. APAP_BH8]|uniref:ABC transporter permease n=1 Tax=Paracoccus TaxID=265 RepID=UPI00048AE0EC|nr:ABC transporter permease subunit [Paracoccus pantotrophus]MDF3854998.1 ABC transporter permease subunit [Paracoccus pantotrophus]RNI18240.1 ABC transporter permease subunit [Paracoccus pantotrophus]SFO57936.1 glycine betaine/proline transport system permease protein [Paracoccus pantotrophus]